MNPALQVRRRILSTRREKGLPFRAVHTTMGGPHQKIDDAIARYIGTNGIMDAQKLNFMHGQNWGFDPASRDPRGHPTRKQIRRQLMEHFVKNDPGRYTGMMLGRKAVRDFLGEFKEKYGKREWGRLDDFADYSDAVKLASDILPKYANRLSRPEKMTLMRMISSTPYRLMQNIDDPSGRGGNGSHSQAALALWGNFFDMTRDQMRNKFASYEHYNPHKNHTAVRWFVERAPALVGEDFEMKWAGPPKGRYKGDAIIHREQEAWDEWKEHVKTERDAFVFTSALPLMTTVLFTPEIIGAFGVTEGAGMLADLATSILGPRVGGLIKSGQTLFKGASITQGTDNIVDVIFGDYPYMEDTRTGYMGDKEYEEGEGASDTGIEWVDNLKDDVKRWFTNLESKGWHYFVTGEPGKHVRRAAAEAEERRGRKYKAPSYLPFLDDDPNTPRDETKTFLRKSLKKIVKVGVRTAVGGILNSSSGNVSDDTGIDWRQVRDTGLNELRNEVTGFVNRGGGSMLLREIKNSIFGYDPEVDEGAGPSEGALERREDGTTRRGHPIRDYAMSMVREQGEMLFGRAARSLFRPDERGRYREPSLYDMIRFNTIGGGSSGGLDEATRNVEDPLGENRLPGDPAEEDIRRIMAPRI